LSYYQRFIEAFPDVRSLSEAQESDVLKQWEGLGYYSRARNLLKGAKYIVDNHGGIIPEEREDLIMVPGIGPYTSSAIAAFAFDKQEAVVDGNVLRVLSRVFLRDEDISKNKTKRSFEALSKRILSNIPPADYNRAIMDLGATVCTAMKPACDDCPIKGVCRAYSTGRIQELPFNSKKVIRRERFLHYVLCLSDTNDLVVRKRDGAGIWQGLYELPVVEKKSQNPIRLEDVSNLLPEERREDQLIQFDKRKHNLTHQTLNILFYELRGESGQIEEYKQAIQRALDTKAFPVPIRAALEMRIKK
jgi:A/G-specific adenine glycosylase